MTLRKRTIGVCLALACLFAGTSVAAQTPPTPEYYEAAADAYVRTNYSDNYGTVSTMYLKRDGSASYNRKALIRFDRTPGGPLADNAVLHFDIASWGGDDDYHLFRVWGVKDGGGACEDFNETAIDWYDCNYFGTYAVNAGSSLLYDGDSQTSGNQPLGEFYVLSTDSEAHFASDALARYVNDDSNDVLTFVIERTTVDSGVTSFASKEHTTLQGPRLEINLPPLVVTQSVADVDDGWKASGLPTDVVSDGILLMQTVSYDGGEAGRIRMDSDGDIRYQESDNDSHTTEDVDIVAIMGDLSDHVPSETGSFSMSGDGNSYSTTLDAVADTYVRVGNYGPYGSDANLYAKLSGGGSSTTTRKALIRFERPIADITAATLRLRVSVLNSSNGVPAQTEFYVWGINEGVEEEHFDAATVLHNDLPFLDTSGDGVTNDQAYLYDGSPGGSTAEALGTFAVGSGDLSQEVTFSSSAFIDFLNADQDGDVSILVTRVLNDGALNTGFASNEHATLAGPALDITYQSSNTQVIEFTNSYNVPVFFVDAPTYNGSDPVAVYPVSVGPDYAIVRMAEGANYDGTHATETVNWAVFEAGFYNLGLDGYLDVGINYVTTTDYSAAGMTSLAPRGADFADSAAVIVQSQYDTLGGWQGTRVNKTTSGGVLTGFDVRHMLDKTIEGSDPTFESFMGWLVIGDATPYGNPGDLEEWSFDGGATDPSGSTESGGADTSGACGSSANQSIYYTTGDSFGSDDVGASYSFGAGITDTLGYDAWIGAEGELAMTLLGTTITVLDLGVEATRDGSTNANGLWVCLLDGGYCPVDESLAVTGDYGASATLLAAGATFFGITVSGSIDGEMGVSLTGTAGASGLSFEAGPYLSAVATASVSAGCCGLSASVNGEIELITLGLPTTADVNVNGSSLEWSTGTDFSWSTLFGSIYLKLKAWFWSKTYELFGWDGYSDDVELVPTTSGCLPL